ncbi:DUF4040 domain-containing protein [Halomicrococcus sp. SG-WS-1]|uniref:DUF4040 domain-containing protein n=1 Tax=Halomicrococcus sp. SG-WS-1 TaxID=3439057 RepID=UPI003F7A28F9
MNPLLAVALVVVVGGALVVAVLRDPLAATVAFGGYGLGMATLWAVLRAPDVALTEAAVGAGITSALLLVAIARTGRATVPASFDWRPALAVAALVVALAATVPALPTGGEPIAPGVAGDVGRPAGFYLANAPEMGVENVVTAVLVVYRGFDTVGEVFVVFAAGLAALVVLGGREW